MVAIFQRCVCVLTVESRDCRAGGTPSSGSVLTLKSGPQWASAGWTWRSRPGGKNYSEHFLTTHTHKVIQNSHSIPRLQTHIKLNNRLAFTDWDTYISSVIGSLLSVVCVMAVACSAIVEGVWTRCRQARQHKQPWLFDVIKGLTEKCASTHTGLLTGWEATSEKHVEEVVRSDVGLKAPVEVEAPPVRVSRTAGLLASHQVILPSLVWIAQHCIRITNLWKEDTHDVSLKTPWTQTFVTMSNIQTFTYSSCHFTTQWYHVRATFYRESYF